MPEEDVGRCDMPRCGLPLDRWPHICRRIKNHDGQHGPPSPTLIGDPWYGNLMCRVCGGEIYADEPHRKVIRLWWLPGRGGWRRSFAHDLRAATNGDPEPKAQAANG